MRRLLSKYQKEFRLNTKLALPIMAGQLGQTAVNFAGNIMVGKLGPSALAAVSFANALFAVFFVVGMGISFALPPLVSEAEAAGQHQKISQYFKHSFVVNITFALVSLVIILLGLRLLPYMGQEADIIPLAQQYLVHIGWSILPFMVFQTLRCYSDGMSETLLPMIIIITGNVINIVLNYGLIFGNWGLPNLGVEGAALASHISRWYMVIGMVVLLLYWKNMWSYIAECNFTNYQNLLFRKIAALGIPTSLQMFFEVSAFSGAAIIMGFISKEAQAGHQVAISLASITFMICTGLAMAATIRVGNQLGRQNPQGIRDAGFSALIQVTVIMGVFGIFFLTTRHFLPTIYIEDVDVIAVASMLLICAAVFQIPDGIQVTAQSALRGLQDVKVPTVVTFISYWMIGIPVSYITSITLACGPIGVWIGLIVGLSLSAALLTFRFHKLSSPK